MVDKLPEEDDNKKPNDSTSMTIITTISITAVCIAAILVISALLILKLRKPVLSPIKMEEIKSCNDQNCSRTFTEQNNSQSYPEYHFVMSEDHDHTVSVVVWNLARNVRIPWSVARACEHFRLLTFSAHVQPSDTLKFGLSQVVCGSDLRTSGDQLHVPCVVGCFYKFLQILDFLKSFC